MEENNNNLGDFFRKRLSSSKGEDEDWFNPDSRTDDLVLQGLIASSKEKKNRKTLFFILIPCLLFLGMLGYVLHLKNQIALLNNATIEVAQKDTFTTPINETNATLNNTVAATTNQETLEIPSIKTDSEKGRQKLLKRNLEIENQALQSLIAQKNKTIQALQLELSQNCNATNYTTEIAENSKVVDFNRSFPNLGVESISTNEPQTAFGTNNLFLQAPINQLPSLLNPVELEENQVFKELSVLKPKPLRLPLEALTSPTADYSFSLKKKKKRRQNSFEIGLHAGIQVLYTEKQIDILGQRIIANEALQTEQMNAPYLGLSVGYSPIKNLWIRTGIQLGGNRDYLEQKMGIVYNDAQEYLLPSGDRASDLLLSTSTGYTEVANTLQLRVPSTTTNGDLLELDYQDELNTKYLQIPLSVEYFFGSKKWQPFIHLGAKWNLFHYEYKTLGIDLKSDNQAINFNLKEGTTNIKTFQYMSFVTGAGLSWNLRSTLSLRTTLGLEGNFLLNESQKGTTDYSKNGLFAHFGLYYKF